MAPGSDITADVTTRSWRHFLSSTGDGKVVYGFVGAVVLGIMDLWFMEGMKVASGGVVGS